MANVAPLEPGDILLFTSDGSHIDEIICLLTQSDVAHSALFYGNSEGTDILVDAATGCGIAAHQMEVLQPKTRAGHGATWDQREIYVRRLRKHVPIDVLNAARKYARQNNRFNMMGLILVGFHLLFRMEFLPQKIEKLLIELLQMLKSELWGLGSSQTGKKGPHPMYCSQFVYQCFDAGGIPLTKTQKGAPGLSPTITLLDRIQGASTPPRKVSAPTSASLHRGRTLDNVAEELEEALRNERLWATRGAAGPSSELVQATEEFGLALQKVQQVSVLANQTGLQFLKELQGQYVTPAELKDHCSDLKSLGQKEPVPIRRNRTPCTIP